MKTIAFLTAYVVFLIGVTFSGCNRRAVASVNAIPDMADSFRCEMSAAFADLYYRMEKLNDSPTVVKPVMSGPKKEIKKDTISYFDDWIGRDPGRIKQPRKEPQ